MMVHALAQVRRILGLPPRPEPLPRQSAAPIPEVVARRLRAGPDHDPLFPTLLAYGKGRPGVSKEREWWWVIRDQRGKVVGRAVVADMGPDHPVSIDVAVDPARQGEGWGSALYGELEHRGIDMEAGSAASVAHGTMSPASYRFMLARRLKVDPDAGAKVLAVATIYPGCGPIDERGEPLTEP